jgi:hypothetical protein
MGGLITVLVVLIILVLPLRKQRLEKKNSLHILVGCLLL